MIGAQVYCRNRGLAHFIWEVKSNNNIMEEVVMSKKSLHDHATANAGGVFHLLAWLVILSGGLAFGGMALEVVLTYFGVW